VTLAASSVHALMQLDDAVADVHVHVEAGRAQRAFVVLVGKMSATFGPVIKDRFCPVPWRLMLQVPHVSGGVVSATILDATKPAHWVRRQVP